MLRRRSNRTGLLAVLLALMAQLGAATAIPPAPVTAAALCQTGPTHTASAKPPARPADCAICPLCGVLQTQTAAMMPAAPVLTSPAVPTVRGALPPPSPATAAAPRHADGQPRAPPCSPEPAD